MLRRSPLKRVGSNKARALRIYWPRRRAYLLENPYCEIPNDIPECHHDCTLYATSIHHAKGQHWRIMNDQRYWWGACVNGHAWVEANKNRARKMGIILY